MHSWIKDHRVGRSRHAGIGGLEYCIGLQGEATRSTAVWLSGDGRRLKLRLAKLPQKEAPFVGRFLLPLFFGISDAVTRLIIHPEQDRLVPGCRHLQAGCHPGNLPRGHVRIVDPGGQHNCGVGRVVRDVGLGTHRVQVLKSLLRFDAAEFGNIGRPVFREFREQSIGNADGTDAAANRSGRSVIDLPIRIPPALLP
jgi:hypothetical protein